MDVYSDTVTPSQLEVVLSGHIEMTPGTCSCADQEDGEDYTPHAVKAVRKSMRDAVLIPAERVLFPISAAVKVMHSVLGTDTIGEWIGTCKSRNGVPLKELAGWIAGEYYVYELHLPDVQKLALREERDINSHSALTGACRALAAHVAVDMVWDTDSDTALFYCVCDPDHMFPMRDTVFEIHRGDMMRAAGTFLMSVREASEYAESFGRIIPLLGMVSRDAPLVTGIYDELCLRVDRLRHDLGKLVER